ncbi:MAG: hypothetical protein COW02_18250 [Comamonadaceae bacterium CG12_big_fil_rev_8_21_14_0_65_59_15]|nr:MAG: hypothetical protein COW02_18250 [Comamonadaceae bacterium CG12_big_fil_rev_8_21_14_0_65_59_15]
MPLAVELMKVTGVINDVGIMAILETCRVGPSMALKAVGAGTTTLAQTLVLLAGLGSVTLVPCEALAQFWKVPPWGTSK